MGRTDRTRYVAGRRTGLPRLGGRAGAGHAEEAWIRALQRRSERTGRMVGNQFAWGRANQLLTEATKRSLKFILASFSDGLNQERQIASIVVFLPKNLIFPRRRAVLLTA